MKKVLLLLNFVVFVQFLNAQDKSVVILNDSAKIAKMQVQLNQLQKTLNYNEYTHIEMGKYHKKALWYGVFSGLSYVTGLFVYSIYIDELVSHGPTPITNNYKTGSYFLYAGGFGLSIASIVQSYKAVLIHDRRWKRPEDKLQYGIK
jgi:hypothetical protein